MDQQQLQRYFLQFQDELNQAIAGFNAKGWEYFKKVLIVAFVLAAFGYMLLYKTTAAQLSSVQSNVRRFTELAKYGQQYKDQKAQIAGIKDKFIGEADRKDWLFNLLYGTSREQGIAIDSISSQKEVEKPDQPFVKLSIDVSCRGTYQQVGKWIAELESAPHFTQIESFSMTKVKDTDPDAPPAGMNTVNMTVSTVLPKGIDTL